MPNPRLLQTTAEQHFVQLLEKARLGDAAASIELFEQVYGQLKILAQIHLRKERWNHTLQSTALVHEVWIKLVGTQSKLDWKSCGHFFAASSEAMRRILVDSARARLRLKRGEGKPVLEFSESEPSVSEDTELVALNDALSQLRELDPLKANVVTMRFFGGYTNKQTAEHLGISTATAERHWTFARAWLKNQLEM
ncbi:MAG: ECF-type sigma factor [Pirellulaceae bacterium]